MEKISVFTKLVKSQSKMVKQQQLEKQLIKKVEDILKELNITVGSEDKVTPGLNRSSRSWYY